jgi:hypothetical protein
MRARHRHFNPRDAEALVALDSRYGFTLSDGDPVSTWEDRTNNNNDATQTSTARPTYETRELGGQPVITFDGSNDQMSVATLSTAITSNALTLLTVSNKFAAGTSANEFSRVISLSNGAAQDFNNTNSLLIDQTQGNTGDLQVFRNSASVTINAGDYAATYIYSTVLDGTAVTSRSNSTGTQTGATSATPLNANRLTIGGVPFASNDSRMNGNIPMVTIIRAVVTNALRKRLEHAAAFSFKIACN